MRKYNELQLIEEKGLRESFIGRIEVLDKVGELLLLPNTEYATVDQIASYYEVGLEAIQSIAKRNADELEGDGVNSFRKGDVVDLLNVLDGQLTNYQGRAVANIGSHSITIPNRGLRLFPKRAILRVGMLLRDSEIAKEVRTRLLDIVHDTQEQSPKIVQGVVGEISEERQLMLDRVEAEMNGDYDTVSVVNAKLFALKNKRIFELENTNKQITTNALTITESRAVINRLVRAIAMKEYRSLFGKAWGELYSKLNYKLGINIKARSKKKNESYINTLTEDETFETEKIVRNWALEVGLNLDELLRIAG